MEARDDTRTSGPDDDALDRARLDDLYQILRWSLAYDAYLESDDDGIEPPEVPDLVDQRGHGRLADHWLARIAAAPTDALAMTRALHCLDLAGRQAERIALVERILALHPHPGNDDATDAAIAALVENGHVARATEVARRLGTASAWLTLALQLEDLDAAAATGAYEQVLAIDPAELLALESFSEHLRTTGDSRRADELAARAALAALGNDGDDDA